MDTYTFCTALGKEEANRQLRIHYENWVTEKDIGALAAAGINSLRIPYGLDILLDMHGLINSQNGFDNSGRSMSVKWTSIASTQPLRTTTFRALAYSSSRMGWYF
ncbi:unnamed protein product [Peronospora farinosa]|uniref:Glycoside hydrolase family 5 domain-containing protein n=1 Tax=Peronospora farinosa TaxID=134698 RepID=A0AAV0TQ64_9STRA|nr:unnamed protein product [Peronospora farinosa]CAI5725644.1 unnamed protein product [Peronospora farinosa]